MIASIRVRASLLCGAVGSQARAERREFAYGVFRSGRACRPGSGPREKNAPSSSDTKSCSGFVARLMRSLAKDKPRPGNRRVEIACMTLNGRAHSLRPGDQLPIGAVTSFRGQRARNVRHRMSAGVEFSQAQDPITWSHRDRTESGGQGVECFIQVFPSDRLGAPVVNDRACRLAEEQDGVGDPRERMRAEQRAVDDLLARLSERDEMAGEVSTIDRGYVFRIERTEVTRIIPVIEVTPETLEAVHGAERRFEPLDCGHGADPPEIVRGDGGEQIQPEVGGRRAVGHDRCRLFLEIVGRKGVVFRADEGLEEPPGPARGQPQRTSVICRKRLSPSRRAAAG